jgi:hypothetical protein
MGRSGAERFVATEEGIVGERMVGSDKGIYYTLGAAVADAEEEEAARA